ncbi:MAG: (deoxy)nucleoside triphosphate pyrophosphohydrolase [Mogibacterium sp.]|nr:(deoxy)nucleoside triphosphate pyrophosphohydrolase [Mogibacterium sp.]
MKTINVAATIIIKDGRVFATQRGYGDYKDWWEFPGGKLEPGESYEEALVREIREELRADIRVDRLLHTVEYDYPRFHMIMKCFICGLVSDEMELVEHEAAAWLAPEELRSVRWLPSDIEVIEILEQTLNKRPPEMIQ